MTGRPGPRSVPSPVGGIDPMTRTHPAPRPRAAASSRSWATSPSSRFAAAARCQACRSGSPLGSIAAASARWTAARSARCGARVHRGADHRVPELEFREGPDDALGDRRRRCVRAHAEGRCRRGDDGRFTRAVGCLDEEQCPSGRRQHADRSEEVGLQAPADRKRLGRGGLGRESMGAQRLCELDDRQRQTVGLERPPAGDEFVDTCAGHTSEQRRPRRHRQAVDREGRNSIQTDAGDRVASRIAMPSAWMRRPTSVSASRDSLSSHWTSSTTHSNGRVDAISGEHVERPQPRRESCRALHRRTTDIAQRRRRTSACGLLIASTRPRTGCSILRSPEYPQSISDSVPATDRTSKSGAIATAASSNVDLPLPGSPRRTSAPLEPTRAAVDDAPDRALLVEPSDQWFAVAFMRHLRPSRGGVDATIWREHDEFRSGWGLMLVAM